MVFACEDDTEGEEYDDDIDFDEALDSLQTADNEEDDDDGGSR